MNVSSVLLEHQAFGVHLALRYWTGASSCTLNLRALHTGMARGYRLDEQIQPVT